MTKVNQRRAEYFSFVSLKRCWTVLNYCFEQSKGKTYFNGLIVFYTINLCLQFSILEVEVNVLIAQLCSTL